MLMSHNAQLSLEFLLSFLCFILLIFILSTSILKLMHKVPRYSQDCDLLVESVSSTKSFTSLDTNCWNISNSSYVFTGDGVVIVPKRVLQH